MMNGTTTRRAPQAGTWLRLLPPLLLPLLLLAYAIGHLAWRGPISVRGHWNLVDFASPWASSRLWLNGENPYERERLWETWIHSRGAFDTDNEFWLALMPPAAYAALSPLAAMPAGMAGVAWLGLSALSVAVILGGTLSLARIPLRSPTAWLFIAVALAMAPMQTIITVGQLSLPVIALTILALCLARDGRHLGAGLALGLAAAVKPQLAAPFLLYYLFFARWRVIIPALVIVLMLNLLAIVPMHLRGIPWLTDWQANVALGSAPGGPNDPTSTGPWRQQMIDLRMWLFTLTPDRERVLAATIILSMSLAAAYVALLVRGRSRELTRERDAIHDPLLPLAALAALSLLPVYHKAYDAVLLVLALAWALRAWGDRALRPLAALVLLTLCVYLVPFDFLVLLDKRRPGLFDAVEQSWIWRVLVFPHYALATLVTALCILLAFWRSVQISAPRPAPQPEPAGELEELVPTQA